MWKGVLFLDRDDRSTNFASFALSALVGGIILLAVTMALLLVCAVMISAGIWGHSPTAGPVIGTCILGGVSGGLYTGMRWGGRRLLAGLAAGATGFLLLMLLRLLLFGSAGFGGSSPGVLAGCLCGSALPGFLPRRKKRKKKRR